MPNTTSPSKPCANSTRLPQDAPNQGNFPQEELSYTDRNHILPSVAHRLTKAKMPVTLTANGLIIHPDATDDQRKQLFKFTKNLNNDAELWLRFAMGDAYNALPGDYGTKTKWVEDTFGGKEAVMQLKKYRAVASCWKHEDRDMTLPWSFYAEVSVQSKFGEDDRKAMAAKYKIGNLTIEQIREIKRDMAGPKEIDELDMETWPVDVRNAFRLFLQQEGIPGLRLLLRNTLSNSENEGDSYDESEAESACPNTKNAGSENTKNRAVLGEFQMEHRPDVGSMFAAENTPEEPCSEAFFELPTIAENADIRSAWEVDTPIPQHSSPPSGSRQASGKTKPGETGSCAEKSDNKKEDSYCRISGMAVSPAPDAGPVAGMWNAPEDLPPDGAGMLCFESVVKILYSCADVTFERQGNALTLSDPQNLLDPAVRAAVNWHEVALMALHDCRTIAGRLRVSLVRLGNGEPLKRTRAEALTQIAAQIESLGQRSAAYCGMEDGWPDPDPWADREQVKNLRSELAEAVAGGQQ